MLLDKLITRRLNWLKFGQIYSAKTSFDSKQIFTHFFLSIKSLVRKMCY